MTTITIDNKEYSMYVENGDLYVPIIINNSALHAKVDGDLIRQLLDYKGK